MAPGCRACHGEAVQTLLPVGADRLWVEDSETPGPAVALLHEGIADSRMWDGVWPDLVADFRVVRYDVRGFGRSPAPTQQYQMVDDLFAVLDALDIERATLVGCSIGGGTALGAALSDIARVASLVLLAPGIPGYPWPDEPELDAELDRLFEAGDEDAILAALLREWAAAGSEPLIVDMMRSAVRAWEYEGTFQQKPEPVFDRLGQLDVPAALMFGDLDRPPLIACAEATAERLPNCELIRMPGVDHLPTMREPGWVANVVRKYAANHL